MRQSPSYIWSVTPDSCVGCWLCNNLWLKVKTKKWKRQKTCHIELSICTERGWTQNIKIMGSIVVHLLCHRVNMYNIFLHLLAPKFTPVAHALMLKVNYGFPWTQHLGHCPTLHSSCDFHCSSFSEDKHQHVFESAMMWSRPIGTTEKKNKNSKTRQLFRVTLKGC